MIADDPLKVEAASGLKTPHTRVRVQRDLGMIVRAEKLRAFHTDDQTIKSCAFGGTADNTDVVRPGLILQRRHASHGQRKIISYGFAAATRQLLFVSTYDFIVVREDGASAKHQSGNGVANESQREAFIFHQTR
jgi:hypothetical protein